MKSLTKYGLKSVLLIFTMVFALSFALKAHAFKSIASRGNSVTVNVQPVQLEKGQPVKFQVRMSTHSVELGDDMIAASELKDDQGKGYQPANWQGSPPGGHHRKGVLEFPMLGGGTKSVTLIIKNIANVPERIFEWELK